MTDGDGNLTDHAKIRLRAAVPAAEPAAPSQPPIGDSTSVEVEQRLHVAVPEPVLRARSDSRVGRFVLHEWTLLSVAGLLLAVVMTWPTLRHPATTIPEDIYDPLLQAWEMAWAGHALMTEPAQLWQANAFFPDRYGYAYSDSLLGYAPLGMIGTGPTAAIVRYNAVYVLQYALAFIGMDALLRQLGARWAGAAIGAVAFAYAPWRLAHGGHLNVLSVGGIVLGLAMLARGHGWSLRDGYQPAKIKPGWVYAGWAVAAWQITLGWGVGLPFAYVLATIAVVAVVRWARSRPRMPFRGRLVLADAVGAGLFTVVGAVMAVPYFRVVAEYPSARRTPDWLPLYSPPLDGFLTAPESSWLWGQLHQAARASLPGQPETLLLPGAALIGLALVGLAISAWSLRLRLWLLTGAVSATALAMGTQFLDGVMYLALYHLLPGWDGIRTPGRLLLYTTIFLAILAAGAISYPGWPRWISLIFVVLVTIECLNTTPHPTVPPQPAAMRAAAGPILVLPSDQLIDDRVMLWSTDRFPALVNGSSGFVPPRMDELRKVTATFPDAASVAYLRRLGVKTVIVMPDLASYEPDWNLKPDAPIDGLGLTRSMVDRCYVFTIQ